MSQFAIGVADAWRQVGKSAFGGGDAFEQGRSNMANALAQESLIRSQADYHQAKADQINKRNQMLTPEFGNKIAMNLAGLTEPQQSEYQQFQSKGNWGQDVEKLADGVYGPPLITDKKAPEWATPQRLDKLNTARAMAMAGLTGEGGIDMAKLAKSITDLTGTNMAQDRALQGGFTPQQIQQFNAFNAADKGRMFDQGTHGVLDNRTGQFVDPALFNAAVMKDRAQANNANASASQHIAQRDLTRSKIGQGQTMTMPDGTVVQTGKAENIPWKYDAGSDEFVAPPTPEFPNGRRSGNIAKNNAAKSLEYVISQFDADSAGNPVTGDGKTKAVIDSAKQGGPLGLYGIAGKVIDSQDARRFDNLKEQLSTELRTLFRIPGEGTLSDKEQAQYGIQLPDVKNNKETNRAILNDIKQRVKLRQDQSSNPLVAPRNIAPSADPRLSSIPQEAIEYARKNPNLINAFAAKYGKDAADALRGK